MLRKTALWTSLFLLALFGLMLMGCGEGSDRIVSSGTKTGTGVLNIDSDYDGLYPDYSDGGYQDNNNTDTDEFAEGDDSGTDTDVDWSLGIDDKYDNDDDVDPKHDENGADDSGPDEFSR